MSDYRFCKFGGQAVKTNESYASIELLDDFNYINEKVIVSIGNEQMYIQYDYSVQQKVHQFVFDFADKYGYIFKYFGYQVYRINSSDDSTLIIYPVLQQIY